MFGFIFSEPKAVRAAKGGIRMAETATDGKIQSLINRRERQILVHSYIYYEKDTNLISDDQWSAWAFELAELRDKYPKEFNKSPYAWVFDDFDPSSGYYLEHAYIRPEIVSRAEYLLKVCRKAG